MTVSIACGASPRFEGGSSALGLRRGFVAEGGAMGPAKNVNALVEHQARWAWLRGMLEERPVCTDSGEHRWIAISRQTGSGGSMLARAIGETLGWRVMDREIVAEIARAMHRSEPLVATHDEHASGPLDDYLSYLIVPGDPGQTRFIEEMIGTIRALVRKENVVIVGRGANWFLNPRCGLRLRIVAPFEQRVDLVAQRLGIGREEAARSVRDLDAEQRAFIRQSFGRDVDDPLGYDVVINLGTLPFESATGIVLAALERKFAAPEAPAP
jgi:cytidylate kinase